MSIKQLRFPHDLAALLGLCLIGLPIAALGALVFPAFLRARNEGDLTILWAAIAIGAIGSSLLFWARLPLYREHRFFCRWTSPFRCPLPENLLDGVGANPTEYWTPRIAYCRCPVTKNRRTRYCDTKTSRTRRSTPTRYSATL